MYIHRHVSKELPWSTRHKIFPHRIGRNLPMMRSVIFLSTVFAAAIQVHGNVTSGTRQPVGPQDRDDYGPWVACDEAEGCLQKRFHRCANSTKPHIECGSEIWKQALVGCYTCPDHVWQSQGEVSACFGTGCGNTVQHFEDTCANRAVNPNCKLVRTRFCSPAEICDGTWSSWSSDSPECHVQCGLTRRRDMHRTCMKASKKSSSCAANNGEKSISTMEETYFDHCKGTPCHTTVASTTTTATTTTTVASTTATTQPRTTTKQKTTTTKLQTTAEQKTAIATAWSAWSACNATCKQREGIESRFRKCIYGDGKPALDVECTGYDAKEERKCSLANTGKCKKGRSFEDKIIPTMQTTMGSPAATEEESTREVFGDSKNRFQRIWRPNTRPESKVNTTSANSAEGQSLEGHEIRVLIIVLVTTAVLILVVLLIYIFCGRRSRVHDRRRRRKLGEIKVVGLQSHTGFMEGMESYGFTKSMLPTGPLLSAVNGSTDDVPPAADSQMMTLDTSLQVNQNSHHIYEDVRSVDHDKTPHARLQRSSSDREKQQRNATQISNAEFRKLQQAKRKSCFTTCGDVTLRKSAPPKPPRKSMMIVDKNSGEMRDVPKSLYEKSNGVPTPDLNFINSIHPPLNTPPTTPFDQCGVQNNAHANLLDLPIFQNRNGRMLSHSAPASPAHISIRGPIAHQTPHTAYILNPLILPYGGGQFMAPVQIQTGEVLYMPISPIHSPTMQMGLNPPVVMRNKSFQATTRRPQTTGFIPQISISDADKSRLSPLHTVRSPRDDYAEMQHLTRLPPDFNDAEAMKSDSAKKLDSDEVNNNSAAAISEDIEGYLLPGKA